MGHLFCFVYNNNECFEVCMRLINRQVDRKVCKNLKIKKLSLFFFFFFFFWGGGGGGAFYNSKLALAS